MKPKRFLYFLGLLFFSTELISQVDRVEPPFWWTGMKDPHLQLMVHGEGIADATAELGQKGMALEGVTALDSPDYLFIDLRIDPGALPGKYHIALHRDGRDEAGFDFELRKREPGSADRKGFSPSDVIYLAMPDRFANGNPENDVIPGMRENKVDRSYNLGRHGGDLKGVRDHLDYIEEMGFTALWLTPVLENDMTRSSYHGYSITDFYKVDPRLGSNEEFRELALEARERGIGMIMDQVFNHIGSFHPWMKDPPSKDWIHFYPDFVRTNHRRTVNQDPYASEQDRKLMVDGWFAPTMPDLNQANAYLANYLIQNSIWWIEYAGLAGIRMDTYPYPDKEMMAGWNRRVLNEYPDFMIVGEEWSLNPGQVSYWQRGKVNRDGYRGGLPSLMDFPLQSALAESLLSKDGWDSGWLKLYETLASDYEYPDPFNLVIFPDNHDMSRFYMQMGMDSALYKLGMIFFLTIRGIPQIFYGSEILMTHPESNDHGDIRKDFPGGWKGDPVNAFTGKGLSPEALEMQRFFKKLLNWRKTKPVIHSGSLIHFAPEGGVYVYGRYDQNEKLMVVLNKSTRKASLDMERFTELTAGCSTGKDFLTGRDYSLKGKLVVPGKTGLILELHP